MPSSLQSSENTRRLTWDIFCTVVDHYGDIGVCWRLARQLANEHNLTVRLWVNRLDVFQRLCPNLDATLDNQTLDSIEIRRWTTPFTSVVPHDVVIAAFGCELPETFMNAMAQKTPAPLWINLEYLSAESWTQNYHKLPSPHPRLPLTQYFYFPGFNAGTGGLLRERDLFILRNRFQKDANAQQAFWKKLGLQMPAAGELRVSLFCYPHAPMTELLNVWAQGDCSITCLVPAGIAIPEDIAVDGRLHIQSIPFLPQDEYDRLLWACDLNFVRGEDSFVRAQWAARPFVWQIYFQQEDAHHKKLAAFLDLYTQDAARDVRAFWNTWNGASHPNVGSLAETWQAFIRQMPALQAHAITWAAQQTLLPDLATGLVEFARERLQYATF